ncbi:ADP-ribosylglycohydrolase family protein [Caloramator australicus]|uniref:Hydrolase, putative n=1 Tax=Caloramator australicus RC3 TaxID=857293 RepID=I7J6W0_9CLOT|nr:ADP-ribosylglycohydrolase family protein [Caloramator australicus]CCJ34784.1 hydrolase, putative [Caloramator australicus RC3]
MLGAIIGDIVGSRFEFHNKKTKDFKLFNQYSHFTDDTVLTVATMDALLNKKPFDVTYKEWFRKYPDAGYGSKFISWGLSDGFKPYNSFGNGSAMRVSPVGFYYDSEEDVLKMAQESAKVTHNHPEGIKGAQATALAIFLARKGATKEKIKEEIEKRFNYHLDEPLDSIRTWYRFDVSCQGSVPQAIRAFLESEDFEDAIRNAISIGGDSDTIACITGGIAEAYYGSISEDLKMEAYKRLDSDMINTIESFYNLLNGAK